jgi:DNA-binding IclR family transcriptional regulator
MKSVPPGRAARRSRAVVEAPATGVGVVDKSMDLLRALVAGPLDLVGLQSAAGLPRATAHRLATALEAHGMVRRDDRGRFCLGFELVRLGRAASDAFPLAEIAAPVLTRLRDETGESVQLFVRELDARRCVASLQSPHALQWIVPVGALLPLEAGSAGRVLTAASAPGGVMDSVEERERGVASVSAPVTDRAGHVVAAVSVSGPVERMGRTPRRRFGSAVSAAASALSELLG